MKHSLIGSSAALPLDLLLSTLAQGRLSGSLTAIDPQGGRYRLVLAQGGLAFAQGPLEGSPPQVLGGLLEAPVLYRWEAHAVAVAEPVLGLQGVLLEAARLVDEARRESLQIPGADVEEGGMPNIILMIVDGQMVARTGGTDTVLRTANDFDALVLNIAERFDVPTEEVGVYCASSTVLPEEETTDPVVIALCRELAP